ncbi:MAG: hypothetical protein JST88_06225 [Bacteroidetes bacterium]|nr:hypothetical protein [Bacteroidota bacterium]
MRFAIRDDDANYFTTPQALEACYADIWETIPPSLSLISKVKGNWPFWLQHIYSNRHQTDWQGWENDDKAHPIEQNELLTSFLKQQLHKRRLDICFHAKHHRNSDAVRPNDRENNYVRGAEFYTNEDKTNEIITEVAHLNAIFDYNISVFTPPQNLLSKLGYQAVRHAGLNICGGGLSFLSKEKDARGLYNIATQLIFKLKHKHTNYPFVIHYSNHTEIPYHYPLQPTTKAADLISAFDAVRRFDGDFVLSTHYAEFFYPTTYNSKLIMKDVLHEFLLHVSKFSVTYLTLSELLSKNTKP